MLPTLRSLDNKEVLSIFKNFASECDYSPMKLAEKLNLSTRQLQRYFNKITSQTPYEWLHDLRMERAYRALLMAETVKEVAYDMGYKQVSHFSRDFKNHYGHTPSEAINGSLFTLPKCKITEDEEEQHTYLVQGGITLTEPLKCKLNALGFRVEKQQSNHESVSKAT